MPPVKGVILLEATKVTLLVKSLQFQDVVKLQATSLQYRCDKLLG